MTTDLTQTGITIPMSEETELLFVVSDTLSYKMTAGQVAEIFAPKGIPKMCIELSDLRRENLSLKEKLAGLISEVPKDENGVQSKSSPKMSKEDHDALKSNS